jgi:hypothetical protein
VDPELDVPVASSPDGLSAWLILSLSAWISLLAAVGWIAALFAEPVGRLFDAIQRPGAPTAALVDVVMSIAFMLLLIAPIAAALVPAATWYRRLPRRVRRATTGAWIAWVAVGLSGWALAFASDSPGLGFFLVEAAVPFFVGLCAVSLLAALGAVWHTRVSRTPLWHA